MREVSAAERAVMAALHLQQGEPLTATQLARMAQCSPRSARRTLVTVSLFLQIEPEGEVWRLATVNTRATFPPTLP